jgi:hypothetical protein
VSPRVLHPVRSELEMEFDPLANMMASVEYVKREYSGNWATDIEIRPRMAGKATAIEKAKHVKRGDVVHFADGGVIPGPATDGIPAWFRPGERILTPEAAARIGAVRFGLPFPTELDETLEPWDGYPEPPTPACFTDL